MRIYSDIIRADKVRDVLAEIQNVWPTHLQEHGSRKRKHAVEVKLSGTSSYRQNGGEEQAATWDEWGIFIHRLFELDPNAIIGQYNTRWRFEVYTRWRFENLVPEDQHKRHAWGFDIDWMVHKCKCGAVRDDQALRS